MRSPDAYAAIERIVGAPVHDPVRIHGGYTPAERWTFRCGARRLFAKAGVTPLTAALLRREIQAYAALHGSQRLVERAVLVFDSMESTLTPLMERIEAQFPGVKVFSLPSVDHPLHGRHIELGVKGRGDAVDAAFQALRLGAVQVGARLGTESVR